MSNASSEHDQNTLQGITFFWAAATIAMIVIVGLTSGGAFGDIVASQVEALAGGTVNAIGIVAVGGINAIGVISLGLVNSIGVIAIGGVNSVGVISIGGVNSGGIITIGGINSYPIIWSPFQVTIYQWAPRIHTRS